MAAKAGKREIAERLPLDPALLKVLADPVRSFIIYSLVPEAKTARLLALELGCPPTRLYYHLQQLEKHDLIFVERTRLVSGIREKHYRASARDFRLDKQAFQKGGELDGKRAEALLGFVFDQSRIEIGRGLADGRIDIHKRAPEVGALMAYRNVLKLSPEQAARLYARLLEFWLEYDEIAKHPAGEEGQFYAFAVALYPNAVAPADATTAPAPKKVLRPRKGARA